MRGRIPFAICVVAFVARGLTAATLGVIPRDGIVIVETARAVAGGDPGAAIRGVQHPLLPLLAGGLGGSETAAVVLACLFGVLGALAAWRIGTRLGGPAAGLVAGLLAAVAPGLVRTQSVPLAEAVAIPLALWAVERALAARERPSRGIGAGLAAGLAYLARPEALLLTLVLVPGLLIQRRLRAAGLLVLMFLLAAGPYVAYLSHDAGEFTLSRKKPVARYLAAEEGFDAHMADKSTRTGYTRPGIAGAAAELGRSLGEATTWAILPLGLLGLVLLLRDGRARPEVLLLLALLAADLALRFRHVHLHGYLSKRHLAFATAILVPLAARVFRSRSRIGAIAAALVCAVLLTVSVKPRDGEKLPLAEAGRHILTVAGENQRIATWLTPRIPYYARGTNVKLNRERPDLATAGGRDLNAWLYGNTDWLAYVPERLDEKTLRALLSATEGQIIHEFGSGTWRVCLVHF